MNPDLLCPALKKSVTKNQLCLVLHFFMNIKLLVKKKLCLL